MPVNAFQDQFVGNHCFGCGANNPQGLQIKSVWAGPAQARCRFHPLPHHCSGSEKFLNGGISSAIIDCHSVCTAIAYAYQQGGRQIGEGEDIWYVTGEMTLKYQRPVPMASAVELLAEVISFDDKRCTVHCSLSADSKLCISAKVLAVKVDNSWMK